MTPVEIEATLRALCAERLPRTHVTVSLFPAGGRLEVELCEECGADREGMFCASWRARRGETLETAIATIEKLAFGRKKP